MRTRWARWEVMWRVGQGRSSGMRGMLLSIQRIGTWLTRMTSPGSSPAPLNSTVSSQKSNQEEEVPSGSEWSNLRMNCRWGDWSSWHSLHKTCLFGCALAHSCPLNSLQWMAMDLYSRDNIALERNSPSASSPGETLGGPGKGIGIASSNQVQRQQQRDEPVRENTHLVLDTLASRLRSYHLIVGVESLVFQVIRTQLIYIQSIVCTSGWNYQ